MSMTLKDRIPKEFYSLFRTKNMDAYMQIVVALYEENNEVYASLGLTREECQIIIADTISKTGIVWQTDYNEDESDKDSGSMDNHDDYNPDSEIDVIYDQATFAYTLTPSAILGRLINWGWIRSDFDEKLNTYVIAFPQYSQMYAELFKKLLVDDDSRERESILAVYSALFTYFSDPEKNNDILKNALYTSKNLGQLLSNMQDGMRAYFDELSRMKDFIGIQKVLIKEINNSDSRRYAILTTTDSFYRYKEAVKELIEKNLGENETRREGFVEKLRDIQVQLAREEQEKSEERNVQNKLSIQRYRLERAVKLCDEANEMLYRISREFDAIERRYNMLIEQKTVFASRAAARIRYILMEGAVEEDQTIAFVNLLTQSEKRDEILDKLSQKMKLTEPYRVMNEKSLYQRRDRKKEAFVPQAVTEVTEQADSEEMNEYVLKPLYTQKEIREFRKQNEQEGNFIVTKDTVKSMEDLEKLFLVWQDATEVAEGTEEIEVGEELENENGLRFSKLVIKKSQ